MITTSVMKELRYAKIRPICNENKVSNIKEFMWSLKLLNIFWKNIQKILVFIHLVKSCSDVRSIFAKTFPILPIDTQQISQKTISHYQNIWVTNQNIRYLWEFLYFGTRFCQGLRKNPSKLLYLKENWKQNLWNSIIKGNNFQ